MGVVHEVFVGHGGHHREFNYYCHDRLIKALGNLCEIVEEQRKKIEQLKEV